MASDESYPDQTISIIAFGSCHKNRGISFLDKSHHQNGDLNATIWHSIRNWNPNVFIWSGDIIYTRRKSIAPLVELQEEYQQLKTNSTIGYNQLLFDSNISVIGTWDDHDYGANDYGKQMPQRKERQDLLMDFLDVPLHSKRRQRKGVYSSVTYGAAPKMVKIILLDTRSGRDTHCIPSIGAISLPGGIGSLMASLTRYFSSLFKLQYRVPYCRNARILDDEQWHWFEKQINESDAQLNIIVSSIQVLTSNPFTESFGQFPLERERLLNILNQSGKHVLIISGDVHFGEISGQEGKFLEVTSSGMTHSCIDPVYGFLCTEMLQSFSSHRYHSSKDQSNIQYYYTGKNFGSIMIDWDDSSTDLDLSNATIQVDVHDEYGVNVLSTGKLPFSAYQTRLSENEIHQLPNPINSCSISFTSQYSIIIFSFVVLFLTNVKYRTRKQNIYHLSERRIKSGHESSTTG